MNISRSIINSILEDCVQLSCGYIVGPWSVSMQQSLDCSGDGADLPFADDTCQDAAFVNLYSGAFGVFDGVGGYANAREAATWMADYMDKVINEATCESGKDLAELVNQANRALIADSESERYTTASVVKILSEEPNGFRLAWAHVGDSRIYHITDAVVQQITDDEAGDYGCLWNVVGDRYVDFDCVQQFGEFSVRTGDRVIIVSDGITGNSEDDAMTADELGRYVRSAGGALAAAKLLVAKACKLDDRTVIVIEFI